MYFAASLMEIGLKLRMLTLVLLPGYALVFANSVGPDQLASEEYLDLEVCFSYFLKKT